MFEKKGAYFLFFVLAIISISLVSAGISDFFRVTGQATSQKTNVTVSFRDKYPAVIQSVTPPVSVNPTELGVSYVNISVVVYNFDKLRDLNFSSVFVNITNGSTSYSVQCDNVNNISNREANFSCSVPIWYWDTAGSWNVGATASDIGNKTPAHNVSTYFTYNLLKAMVISPDLLTWPVLETYATNQESDNDPTIINNTGNYNGTIEITGYDLLGEEDISEMISAENFTAGLAAGSVCTSGDGLINATAVTITNAVPNPGNLSKSDGSGQEQIYYCIPNVPNVTSQIYSTLNSSSWVVAYGL
ncbi:MAG: hypothetical protein QXS38_01355 [Candidatus Pacearchaeota archaeon]